MILIISTCADVLHENEFVKPIENILNENDIWYYTKHYKEVNDKDLKKCSKVIISGTSLEDNQYFKDISLFFWIKEFHKPILGICSGMQIIGLVFNGKTKKMKEIGFYKERFLRNFLSIQFNKDIEVYHLHNSYVTLPKEFESYAISYPEKVVQAMKHTSKEIYGVLFHPEVRNPGMILEFCKIK